MIHLYIGNIQRYTNILPAHTVKKKKKSTEVQKGIISIIIVQNIDCQVKL